jgi:hypothetical protein
MTKGCAPLTHQVGIIVVIRRLCVRPILLHFLNPFYLMTDQLIISQLSIVYEAGSKKDKLPKNVSRETLSLIPKYRKKSLEFLLRVKVKLEPPLIFTLDKNLTANVSG